MKLFFETRRLVMRPYAMPDCNQVWNVVRSPQIYATTYAIPRNYPKERVEWWFSFVNNNIRTGSSYELGMFLKNGGAYIGNAGLINVSKDNRNAAVTYFVNPLFWGHQFACEGAYEMLRFGFSELKLRRIYGKCMSHNIASAKVMEKLGFIYEGRGRSEIQKDGVFVDVDHYSILDSEFIN